MGFGKGVGMTLGPFAFMCAVVWAMTVSDCRGPDPVITAGYVVARDHEPEDCSTSCTTEGSCTTSCDAETWSITIAAPINGRVYGRTVEVEERVFDGIKMGSWWRP